MRQLFNLREAPDRRRADVDAYLDIDGRKINFELKSTTKRSFSTVRDFGPDHLAKWRDGLHWIFAVYDERPDGPRLSHCFYASPADMEPWFESKERYIAPDLALGTALPDFVSEAQVVDALGIKHEYSVDDARSIMKNQWSAADYKDQQDLDGGFSLEKMVALMRHRARYVLLRGSTLNNPHIPMGYFDNFAPISEEHASTLRELVRGYLNASATDEATA